MAATDGESPTVVDPFDDDDDDRDFYRLENGYECDPATPAHRKHSQTVGVAALRRHSSEGEDDDDDEVQELNPKHHPLLQPGAMPRMSRAAVEAVVGMVEQDLMGGGKRTAAADSEDEDEEEEESDTENRK